MSVSVDTPIRDHLEPGELESISQLNVRVPRSLHKALKARARDRGQFLEEYVETLLRLSFHRDTKTSKRKAA
jgi:predicted HicB family RNase H-like nuclease